MLMIIIIIIDAIYHDSTPGMCTDPSSLPVLQPIYLWPTLSESTKVLPTFECRAASSCLQVKER